MVISTLLHINCTNNQLSIFYNHTVATSPLTARFTTNGMCAKNNTICMWHELATIEWSRHVISIAATVRSFAHMPLGLSDCNKMVLWPGCEGRAMWNLHKKNVRSVRFVVKRRGCCCNLSASVMLNARFTTNGMCAKNNTIYMWREQAIIEWSRCVTLLLLAATVRSFAHMPLRLSDCNNTVHSKCFLLMMS